jgi:tetratricopeptide (TPR) repeat protein
MRTLRDSLAQSTAVTATPEEIEALYERALGLHATGRDEEAKRVYLAVLERDATHFAALNNLGTMLFNNGYRSAARTAYRQAVAHHPGNVTGRINYGNALYDNDELYQAQDQYEAALSVDPAAVMAHQGLAYVLDRLGDELGAARHRDAGYSNDPIAILPYRGTETPIPVLLLVSALGGNVSTDRFLDDRVFFTTKLFADYYDPAQPVPFHTLAFNAIGDAELCARALAGARRVRARTNAPWINEPDAVAATGRVANARRFRELTGVRAPLTASFERSALAAPCGPGELEAHGFAWPLLVRAPGFHTGHHFVMVEKPDHLAAAIEELPGTSLTVIEYLDARGADGATRKYRVMIVDGALYPLHLAVAHAWKIHYFTAGMGASPEYRAEEAAFLDDMRGTLGPRAMLALEAIREQLGLDYGGIDFGLDEAGNVLLFEANATMLVPPPDTDPIFAYRRAAAERVFAAVEAMLRERNLRGAS